MSRLWTIRTDTPAAIAQAPKKISTTGAEGLGTHVNAGDVQFQSRSTTDFAHICLATAMMAMLAQAGTRANILPGKREGGLTLSASCVSAEHFD